MIKTPHELLKYYRQRDGLSMNQAAYRIRTSLQHYELLEAGADPISDKLSYRMERCFEENKEVFYGSA